MSQVDKERLKELLHNELFAYIGLIMHAEVRKAVECMAKFGKPPVFNCCDPEDAPIIISLFADAQIKAVALGLNAIQLFLEGKLDRLMSGDSRLNTYNRLSDDKKKRLHHNFIETNGWEAFYSADAESSPSSQS